MKVFPHHSRVRFYEFCDRVTQLAAASALFLPTGQTPSKGCEVFVGKIPRDLYEDELVPVFEKIGKIYELRLMMDFSGSNRGYAFVMYTSTSDARRAVKVWILSKRIYACLDSVLVLLATFDALPCPYSL